MAKEGIDTHKFEEHHRLSAPQRRCLIKMRNAQKYVLEIHGNSSSFTQGVFTGGYGLWEVNFGVNFDMVASKIYGLWGHMGHELETFDSSWYDSSSKALAHTWNVNLKIALTPFSTGGIVTQNSEASSAKTSSAFHIQVIFELSSDFCPPKVTLLQFRGPVCFDCGASG